MARAVSFLPWLAALSVAALASAFAYVGVLHLIGAAAARTMTIATVFPYALAVCGAVGVPVALWLRSSFIWVIASLVLAVLVAVGEVAGALPKGGGGEAEGWAWILLILEAVAGLIALVPMALVFAGVAIPTATLVLLLSGEIEALRRGVSVFDLPGSTLRFWVLVVVALTPLATFTLR
jgi:hypothetical protein